MVWELRFPLSAVAIVILAAAGCSRTPRNVTQRVAILGVDNLTGDADLDWVAVAAPQIVASELTGATGTTPLLAASVNDAYAAGATRFLHGYFDRRGADGGRAALHFEFRLEDAASHKMQDVIALDGAGDGGPVQVLAALARRIDPSTHAFSSSNRQAIEAFGRGQYERAVELDPGFSTAWLTWAQSLAASNPAQATEITARALAQSGLRSLADRSRLELLAASLTHDPEAELKALEGLTSPSSTDPNAVRSLAETAMNARQFTRAAQYYQKLLTLSPGDAAAENLLGYAYAFAGDLDSAMKSFAVYRRQPGQEANALDSIGEAYFVNGRFADAERFFLQAQDKDAAMLGGGDLLKAAYARYLAGDLSAADPIFNRFFEVRAQAKDPLLPWKKATWLYGTGRADQARTELESALPSESPQLNELARRQLTVWKTPLTIPRDLGLLKRAYQSTPPSRDGLARTFYAGALVERGQTEEARKLVATWPLPDSAGDSVLQAFLYPRFLALRERLGAVR